MPGSQTWGCRFESLTNCKSIQAWERHTNVHGYCIVLYCIFIDYIVWYKSMIVVFQQQWRWRVFRTAAVRSTISPAPPPPAPLTGKWSCQYSGQLRQKLCTLCKKRETWGVMLINIRNGGRAWVTIKDYFGGILGKKCHKTRFFWNMMIKNPEKCSLQTRHKYTSRVAAYNWYNKYYEIDTVFWGGYFCQKKGELPRGGVCVAVSAGLTGQHNHRHRIVPKAIFDTKLLVWTSALGITPHRWLCRCLCQSPTQDLPNSIFIKKLLVWTSG